jgi:DNA-binding response OmpR family regulator
MSSSTDPVPRPSPDAQAFQATILIVDDDDYVHETLRAALRSLRANIVRAATAAEGLRLARTERPSLAIIDLGLPDADGYQLTRWLRVEPGLEDLRILVVTGHFPDEQAAHEAGADEILGKPLKIRQFLDTVRRQLRARVRAG